jgi:hypothetical protein
MSRLNGVHKKQASLIPLNHDFLLSSEEMENGVDAMDNGEQPRSPSASLVITRKGSNRGRVDRE